MSDFRTQPGPRRDLTTIGGAQQLNVPPPPALGGPPQMGQPGMMNDPSMGGGQIPPQAPQMAPQMGQNGAPNPALPGMAGAFPQQPIPGAGPQSPQQSPQQGGDQQPDELDQYVNWQAQQLMSQGAQQGDPHLGFLQTLKGAKDRDPEGFYMLLGALATGDPQHVAQMAMQLRQQRMGQQAATQQQVMGVARERGQHREAQANRVEDRQARQQDRLDIKDQDNMRSYVNRLSGKGLLDRVERKLGRPIATVEDMRAAQQEESRLNASDKVVKQAGDYVSALSKGPQPMAGLIKAHYDADPNFRQVVEEANSRREEMAKLRKENLKASTLRAQQVAAVASKSDPKTKLRINRLQRQLKEAEDDEDKAQQELDTNTFMTKADVEDTMGYRGLAIDLSKRVDDARRRVSEANDLLDEEMATGGAPTSTPRNRPGPVDLDGDGTADEDGDGNEFALDENGDSTGPPVDRSTQPQPRRKGTKQIDWSRIDAKIGH